MTPPWLHPEGVEAMLAVLWPVGVPLAWLLAVSVPLAVLWPVGVPLAWLLLVSVPLAVTDARTGRLPNAYVVPAVVLTGWALVAVGLRDPPLALGATAAALALGVTAALASAAGALGMGDVKLLLPLVALTGLFSRADSEVPPAVALWTAALTAATVMNAEEGRTPLGPALLGGFWLGLAWSLTPR